MPALAELVERGAHARGLVLAGRDDDVGARGLERLDVRRAARRARRRRSAAPRAPRATSCESSGRRAVESKTTRRGWRCDALDARGQLRVVGQRRADADGDGVDRRAPAVRAARATDSPEIHFESPVGVATLPSSVIADLKSTHGRPVRACLRKAWLASRARRGELAAGDVDLDALVAQDAQAAAARPSRVGSSEATTTRAMPGLDDRVGARRRLALVAARLERDVERRAGQVGVAGGRDRVDLGVRPAVVGVPALAERPRRRAR